MKGNALKAAVAHMMRSQQIILHEGNMGAIRNGACPLPQRKGNSNRVYSAITSRKAASSLAVVICWAFSRRKIQANRVRRMASRLGGPQFTGIAEDGEDIAQNGIGQFRISPGGWPKMAGIPDPILYILEHIKEMPLGQAGLD